MQVPAGVWIAAAVIAVALTWLTIWVTNKAYSRRWEDGVSKLDGQVQTKEAGRKS